MIHMSFAENLIELRKYHNFSQEELAEMIGVSRQTMSKYETGESLPDIEKCKLLANAFGVTVDDLISYEKDDDNLGMGVPPKGKHIFVMAYRWVEMDDLKKDIIKNPQNYTAWFKIIFEQYLSNIEA